MLPIKITTKAGVEQTIDADLIDHIKIGLFECEIYLTDGRVFHAKQDFQEVRRRIREAKRKGGAT